VSRTRRPAGAARSAKRPKRVHNGVRPHAATPADDDQVPVAAASKIPPPRARSAAATAPAKAASTKDRPSAVAIFDTSVPVYMQTVRETSICPELGHPKANSRALGHPAKEEEQ
jgi:hypothetical protein